MLRQRRARRVQATCVASRAKAGRAQSTTSPSLPRTSFRLYLFLPHRLRSPHNARYQTRLTRPSSKRSSSTAQERTRLARRRPSTTRSSPSRLSRAPLPRLPLGATLALDTGSRMVQGQQIRCFDTRILTRGQTIPFHHHLLRRQAAVRLRSRPITDLPRLAHKIRRRFVSAHLTSIALLGRQRASRVPSTLPRTYPRTRSVVFRSSAVPRQTPVEAMASAVRRNARSMPTRARRPRPRLRQLSNIFISVSTRRRTRKNRRRDAPVKLLSVKVSSCVCKITARLPHRICHRISIGSRSRLC